MAWNQNIPQPADKLSQSQADLRGNFQAVQTFIGVNHEAFASPNEGKHKKVAMPSQAAVPAAVAGEIGIGVAAMPGAIIPANPAAVTGGSELYMARTDGVNNFVFPFTASLQATPGWCYLPCGLIMKWGVGVCPGGGAGPTAFVAGVDIPVFNTVLNVQVSFVSGAQGEKWACWLDSFTATTVTVRTDGTAKNFYYLAIGY